MNIKKPACITSRLFNFWLIIYDYFPFTNGNPVFGLSTTCFPAGKSHASGLSSLAK
jgi:hypothetical protein